MDANAKLTAHLLTFGNACLLAVGRACVLAFGKARAPDPSLMRSLGWVFGAGTIVGIGVLLVMPASLQEPKPLLSRWHEEAPPPCANQRWPAVERRCQGWTSGRRDPVDAPKAKTAPPAAPAARSHAQPDPVAARTTPVASGGTSVVASAVATPPDQADESRPKPAAERAPKARRAERANAPIPVTFHASDKSQRTIMINPTSRQDAYYYAARRNVGIGPNSW